MVNAAGFALRFAGQKLRAIFEVHRVEMVPIATPDEAVCLKNPHDLNWDSVSPSGLRSAAGSPPPIVCKFRVDVDGSPVGVHRFCGRAGNLSAVIGPGH